MNSLPRAPALPKAQIQAGSSLHCLVPSRFDRVRPSQPAARGGPRGPCCAVGTRAPPPPPLLSQLSARPSLPSGVDWGGGGNGAVCVRGREGCDAPIEHARGSGGEGRGRGEKFCLRFRLELTVCGCVKHVLTSDVLSRCFIL